MPAFFDTSVLIYSVDTEAAGKYERAADRPFTEGTRHGQVIEGMRVENPFL